MGTGAVGKSAVTLRLITNLFHDNYDPTIEDYYRKDISINDEDLVSVTIIDTAGQEEYSHMREQWIKQGEGFVLVYDISNKKSLDYVEEIRQSMDTHREMDKVPVMIIGNKCDLPDSANDTTTEQKSFRKVTTEEGKAVADKYNCFFKEVSAKDDINILESFTVVAREMKENAPPPAKSGGFCTIL